MDITNILLAAQSGDQNLRHQAEEQLKKLQTENASLYLLSLVGELGNEAKPKETRQIAGLVLKNTLTAKNDQTRQILFQQWLALPVETRSQIKMMVLQTLGSKVKEARHTSAQVVANIAAIELPANQWVESIAQLVSMITSPHSDESKEAALDALGYICEDSDAPALHQQSNNVLTAVIQGMRKEETNNEVRRAACMALYNALEFVKDNFGNKIERDFIMQVTCEATQCPDKRVREAAFECLVKIVSLYYEHLEDYIETLFGLTMSAAKDDSDEVGQQAIEFWSTMCDVEMEILEEHEDAEEDVQPTRKCFFYVKKALSVLVKLLTATLTKQEEDQDEDDWNVSTAAGTCLNLVSQVVGDDIVGHCMSFISENINSQDWHFREAATLAFGCILEGPTSSILAPLVDQAVPLMLSHMKDPITLVRDTTSWTLGKIAELHAERIVTTNYLAPVLQTSMESLKDEPRVASKACWIIHNIAQHYGEDDVRTTYPLSQYFQVILQTLLLTTERSDADEANLRSSAYEALNVVLQSSADDTQFAVSAVVPVLLQRLQATIEAGSITTIEKEELNTVQGLLCGALQTATRKLGSLIQPYADKMMELFLRVFSSKSATVHEESLMAVGALANAIEQNFEKYMDYFIPFLNFALKNAQEDQVCTIAVGVVGDLCTALGEKLIKYTDEIMNILLQDLQNPNLNRNVKPAILACFGDISLAIGPHFEKYLNVVASVLLQASQMKVDTEDEEMVDYLNLLRENILEAYTGILQGLKDTKAKIFAPYLNELVNFLTVISNDNKIDEHVFKNAVGVIGDIANVYGADAKALLGRQFAQTMVREAAKSKDENIRSTGVWAKEMLKKL